MQTTERITVQAPAGTKAEWVHRAGGRKLSEWVVQRVGGVPDVDSERARFEAWFFSGYTSKIERTGTSYTLMSAHANWCAWRAAVGLD